MDSYTRSSRNAFTGYGLDRGHRQLQDADWVAQQLQHPKTLFLPVWQMQHLIAADDLPRPVALAPNVVDNFLLQAESVTLLGRADGRVYVALDLPATEQPPETLAVLGQFRSLREVGPLLSDVDSGILAYARAMIYWHQQHRFCGWIFIVWLF